MARLLEQRKQFTKNAIHEAARTILSQEGFEALTMERVAETAGVAKGSLYNYFPNKLELIRFVRIRLFDPLAESFNEIVISDAGALEKLHRIFHAWLNYAEEHGGLLNRFFNDHAIHKLLRQEDLADQETPIRVLAQVINQGVEEGVFRPVDSGQFARLLFGATRDLSIEQLASKEPWPVKQMVEMILDFFLHGVMKTKGR